MTLLAVVCLGMAAIAAGPLPYKAVAKLPDVAKPVGPERVKLGGYLGNRVDLNESARLREVDLEPLLAGFRKRPGSHPWIGEHVGKWMHAATLAWANSRDSELKKKLDNTAHELVKCQELDGYLGTYLPEKRFGLYPEADWDVWSHKYCLLGLLTYYRYTGSAEALDCCRKMGDLLIATFGPGKKSILSAGTHMGMAATSVLEPVVLLYRQTGDKRYLEFANRIVASWDEPGGPKILASLSAGKHVGETANGKAYEMLSNLVGLCELARATGDKSYLKAAETAWADIVANQLYITGSASYYEHFHGDHDLPNAMSRNVGETCVTVTWIQLCAQLLRLTGEAKYGDELERSYYNHLAAAQNPDGKSWCYYTSLEGIKPYTDETCCCLSSGPRGMAMAPTLTCLTTLVGSDSMIVINLFDSFTSNVQVGDKEVRVEFLSEFPIEGHAKLRLTGQGSARVGLRIRVPKWADPVKCSSPSNVKDGWLTVAPRVWKERETVQIDFRLEPTLNYGREQMQDKAAVTYGPFVLALDDKLNHAPAIRHALATGPIVRIGEGLTFRARVELPVSAFLTVALVPFAEAGVSGGRYRVWMPGPGTTLFAGSVFFEAEESRSVTGNVEGSIIDGDADSFVVTWDGNRQETAWFSFRVKDPVEVRRVVFVHGRTFHDGGWFDSSVEKPRVEVQAVAGGAWTLVGHLGTYPATTASDACGLKGGESFALELPGPALVVAVRVIGMPACGDNPAQSFASCAELHAFSK